MSAAELHSATDRIDRLERKLRRQTRGVIGFAVLAAATSLLIGQAPSRRTLEAEEFILRGPQGQELATLDATGTGAALALYDSQHHLKMVLRSDTLLSAITLLDSGQKGQIALLSSDDDGPALVLRGSDLKRIAMIGVPRTGPNVQLHDEQGRIRAEFGMTEFGPAMRMWDSNSDTRAVVAISDEIPMISVAGPARKGGVMMAAGGPWPGALTKKGGDLIITKPDGKTIAWAAP
jgi:hypothetical protein